MKKLITVLMAVVMCVGFYSCGKSTSKEEKMVIVAVKDIINSDYYKNSFVLENAWCDCDTGEVVVCVDGDDTNDEHNFVAQKYKYYKNGKFMLRTKNPSIINPYYEEKSQRLLEITEDSSLRLSKSSIDNIQHLYEENEL